METKVNKGHLRGGAYLIEETASGAIFIPEETDEEQRMVRQMVRDFTEQVGNRGAELGEQVALMRMAGELGLLRSHIPEPYGGMPMSVNTNTVISEELGRIGGGFTTTIAAHTGIGMLPILYFGTEEQKRRYLPKLASGEWRASYCLTEPGSGSDALAAKTRADLSADGRQYLLSGQKMWISNAGFADLFIVFAQVAGEHFTGFIVERGATGLTVGAEERKMGIKGSSTRQVFFDQVAVPVENVLGEVGKGHLIAFNTLNIGRFKLGVMCVGGSKRAAEETVRYALARQQFGQPIAAFGAIRHKLAEQAIRIFALESACYRISDLLQREEAALVAAGADPAEAMRKAAEEYAIECAIAKVYGSEVSDFVVDEMVQVHGGNGYSEEYPAAGAYRDARINRIYEGTNEINRLLMVTQLVKRAMKGQLDLASPAWSVQRELASMPVPETGSGPYAAERKALTDFRKMLLMTAGAAMKRQLDGELDLREEQEIVMNVADMMTEIFVAESLLLRVERLQGMSGGVRHAPQSVYEAMLRVFFSDAGHRMVRYASDALASFAEGDLLRTFLMGVRRFSKYPAVNVKEARRLVAGHLTTAGDYRL
ncbi:MAG: hypothetical protein RLY31_2251 [Bacteroidota bacterium]|jgi:alkylation response protein AidB-like acyl-CoA dehydrogenase